MGKKSRKQKFKSKYLTGFVAALGFFALVLYFQNCGGGSTTPSIQTTFGTLSVSFPSTSMSVSTNTPQLVYVFVTGGTAPYTYTWSITGAATVAGCGNTMSCNITFPTDGTYNASVSVTDSAGNSGSASATITSTAGGGGGTTGGDGSGSLKAKAHISGQPCNNSTGACNYDISWSVDGNSNSVVLVTDNATGVQYQMFACAGSSGTKSTGNWPVIGASVTFYLYHTDCPNGLPPYYMGHTPAAILTLVGGQ